MDVFLQRGGADGIHRKPLTAAAWDKMSKQAEAWREEELTLAMKLIDESEAAASTTRLSSSRTTTAAPAVGSTVTATVKAEAKVTEELKAARKIITATVKRSSEVFGAIFAALPEELKSQVAHIEQGWAYGLWHWLETKYQSTEDDSIGALIAQWTSLKQDEGESFDAYRARLNKVSYLLKKANEEPSANMYAYMLLDKLLPRHQQAVLALKASDKLKDKTKVNWDEVTMFINAHERSEDRSDDTAATVMSASTAGRGRYVDRTRESEDRSPSPMPKANAAVGRSAGSGSHSQSKFRSNQSSRSGRRGPMKLSEVQCFNCQEYGHFQGDCTKSKSNVSGKPSRANDRSPSNAPARAPYKSQARSINQLSQSSQRGDESEEESDVESVETSTPATSAKSSATANKKTGWLFALTFAEVVKGKSASADSRSKSACEEIAKPQVELKSTPIEAASNKPQSAPAAACAVKEASDSVAAASNPTSPTKVSSKKKKEKRTAHSPKDHAVSAPTPPVPCIWGIDTMASISVSGDKKVFVGGLAPCEPIEIEVANGASVRVTRRGTVHLHVNVAGENKTVRISVPNVYYHKTISSNLLSWDKLRLDGWEMHSDKKGTHVLDPSGQKLKLSTRGRVSILKCSMNTKDHTVYRVGEMAADSVTSGTQTGNVEAMVRLHQQLGHLNFDSMMQLMKSDAIVDLKKIHLSPSEMNEARRRVRECDACLQGKATRTHFGHRGLDRGTKPGECLHFDTYQVSLEYQGKKWLEYALVCVDPFTEAHWLTKLDNKSEGPHQVINMVKIVQTQLNSTVKRLYTDGGTEFINRTLKEFCAKEGIELHYSPPRTQQLNGIAERAVRTNKDSTRTLISHASAPSRFWYRAARHAIYLRNRTHVASSTGMTPYEAFYGKKPSALHCTQGVWGCNAFIWITKEQRDTFGSKVEPCIYLGHDSAQNSPVVYVLRTGKTIVARDVTYRCNSFTHAKALLEGTREALESALIDDSDSVVWPRDPTVTTRAEYDIDENKQSESASQPVAGRNHDSIQSDSDEEEEYQIESIQDQRKVRGRQQYLVKWAGYDDPTWEPAEYLAETEALQRWHGTAAAPESVTEPAPQRQSARIRGLPPGNSVSQSDDRSRSESTASTVGSGTLEVLDLDADDANDKSSDESDSNDDSHPHEQVRMAMVMSALDSMQPGVPSRRRPMTSSVAVVKAVSSGVAMLEQQTPTTYRAAVSSPDSAKWRAGMDKEMDSCQKLGVWQLVSRSQLPKGANVLPVKWVYKIKTDETGAVTQYKARLTPKGFRQKEGVDYFEVYARTGMYKSMRLGLSLAAKWDHELEQLDVPTAFLNAELDEEVYMELPDGYRDGKEGFVCKLNKALYGLKQSPRQWYLLVSKFMTEELDFKASVSDPCLFHKRSSTGRKILLFMFVDDFKVNFHREDRQEWNQMKAQLVKRFNTKDMGEAKWILGMRISRDRKARTITLDQELYITKALERYGLAQCKVAPTPEVVGAQDDRHDESDSYVDRKPVDRQRFMEIVGTLMYAAISTRPDIAHAVHRLASHMIEPTHAHMVAAERVLRYLSGTRELGLVFGTRNDANAAPGDSRGRTTLLQVDVCAYADADWANNKGDRKSVTGWVAKLNGDPVSWAAKKQRTVALSTCEAELYAEAAAIQEVLWLRGLMKELGLYTRTGSIVHGDNQSTIAVSKNGVRSERTKHVDVKYHFITETVERGDVVLKWVPTNEQHADIFTKALAAPVFEQLRRQLMTR